MQELDRPNWTATQVSILRRRKLQQFIHRDRAGKRKQHKIIQDPSDGEVSGGHSIRLTHSPLHFE